MSRFKMTSAFAAVLALLFAGCATVGRPAATLLPTASTVAVGPFLVASNAPIDEDSPAVRHLEALRSDFESAIGLPVDPDARPVEVYILDDRRAFAHFLSVYYPELPPRRAFFFAQGDRRVVYTYYGDQLAEDLRHEATHALLHASFGNLPLWLDEGLAEYYESAPEPGGPDPEHLGRLPDDLAAGWSPDLLRLEALGDVRQMTPRDYRESWAWAHFLLNDSTIGRPTLRAYLMALRAGETSPSLSDRLVAAGSGTPSVLLSYVDTLRRRELAASAPSSPPSALAPDSVRLQDDPIPVEPRRARSRLGRTFEFLLGIGRGPRPEPGGSRLGLPPKIRSPKPFD